MSGSREPEEGSIAGVDLRDDEYHVVQSLWRNRYRATDAAGDLVLQGTQKAFRLKEEFPFVDADGEPAFTVKAEGMFDAAGDYTLTDDTTEEAIAGLDRHWTLVTHKWTIREPDTGEEIATIESDGRLLEVLRNLPLLRTLLPHSYEIRGRTGARIGTIEGKLSLTDEYDVNVENTSDVPREVVVAAAMVIDAIERN